MSVVVDDEHRINVSIPINVLARLFSAQHLLTITLRSTTLALFSKALQVLSTHR